MTKARLDSRAGKGEGANAPATIETLSFESIERDRNESEFRERPQLTIILVKRKLSAMFVCMCNGHRSSDIRRVAASGVKCPREIYIRLGKPARCGRCLEFASRLVDEVHATLAAEVSTAPAGARLEPALEAP
jgi:bacterioferritin-associated ferredoxin